MRKFDWGAAIGFGILIGLFAFLLGVGAAVTGVNGLVWVRVGLALIAGIFAYAIAGVAQRSDQSHVFKYCLVWGASAFCGELMVAIIFTNLSLATSWEELLGYCLVLAAPWSRVRMHAD